MALFQKDSSEVPSWGKFLSPPDSAVGLDSPNTALHLLSLGFKTLSCIPNAPSNITDMAACYPGWTRYRSLSKRNRFLTQLKHKLQEGGEVEVPVDDFFHLANMLQQIMATPTHDAAHPAQPPRHNERMEFNFQNNDTIPQQNDDMFPRQAPVRRVTAASLAQALLHRDDGQEKMARAFAAFCRHLSTTPMLLCLPDDTFVFPDFDPVTLLSFDTPVIVSKLRGRWRLLLLLVLL
jgi:hypothetical protein